MALRGTLKDFGLSDIFQLIAHQRKTGVLHLEDKGKGVNVTFEEGKVVDAIVSGKTKEKERIGHILLRSGLLSSERLQEILDEQKRTMKKIGVILLEKQYLSAESFKSVLEFQVRETLFRIFQWTSGSYRFEAGKISYDKDFVNPLSAEFILMEAARIIDEWPAVKIKIPSMEMVFARVAGAEEKVVKRSQLTETVDEVDEAFDLLGGEEAKPKSHDPDKLVLTGQQERILDLLDGNLTVKDLAYRSLMGDFETAKNLIDLLGYGLVKPVKVPASVPKAVEKAGEPVRARRFLTLLGTTLVVILVLLAAFYTFSFSGYRFLVFSQMTSEKAVTVRQSVAQAQRKRLALALEVHRLQRGGYPVNIENLVQNEYVLPSDVTYPFSSPYRIEGTQKGPVLLNPEE